MYVVWSFAGATQWYYTHNSYPTNKYQLLRTNSRFCLMISVTSDSTSLELHEQMLPLVFANTFDSPMCLAVFAHISRDFLIILTSTKWWTLFKSLTEMYPVWVVSLHLYTVFTGGWLGGKNSNVSSQSKEHGLPRWLHGLFHDRPI